MTTDGSSGAAPVMIAPSLDPRPRRDPAGPRSLMRALQLVRRDLDREPARRGGGDDVLQRSLRDEPALLQQDDVVARRLDLGQPVRAQQRRRAALGQLPDEVADLDRALGIEAVGRLVEHDDRGIADERERDPDALAHAERERADRVLGAIREPDAVQDLPHLGVLRREALGRDADLEVVQRAEVLVQRRRLDDRADLAGRLAEPRLAGLLAEDAGVPAVGRCSPSSTRIAVDLPAPLGPSRPTTDPAGTWKERSSSTVRLPKRLTSPSNSIGGRPPHRSRRRSYTTRRAHMRQRHVLTATPRARGA